MLSLCHVEFLNNEKLHDIIMQSVNICSRAIKGFVFIVGIRKYPN